MWGNFDMSGVTSTAAQKQCLIHEWIKIKTVKIHECDYLLFLTFL